MSNSFLAEFDEIAHGAFADVGQADAGLYTLAPAAGIACRVFIDRAPVIQGEVADTYASVPEASIMLADIPNPEQGAILTVGTESWQLESEVRRDESIARFVLGPVPQTLDL